MHNFLANNASRWPEAVADSVKHMEWSPKTVLAVLFAGTLAVVLARLALHPLRRVPGPLIATLTTWYEFYYDVVLGGVYIQQVLNLHEKYGESLNLSSVN